MTLRLKVGRKGYIILPKALREAVGINEGDEVIVEIRDGILIRPIKKFDEDKLRKALKNHHEKLMKLNTIEPKPGDLKNISLEEEFEN
ncbi:MAG: AbrB/MazE/SpoVT family DNA-binding domain-containing protein [Desulfurococcales archaeon]|nr:AbrB/MazE/SpoVT family DNA-binding domain-containing protein [Desulfurococcales archaeon]MCE4627339.1 AbrB/MazE/SpoVT family DNA-binding domain-containing protein [Desulfurococcales archaeon]